MDSTLPPLLQATSGAIGSIIGNATVFPLDLATTRFQHAPRSEAQKSKVHSDARANPSIPHFDLASTSDPTKALRPLRWSESGYTLDTTVELLYFYMYSALHKLATKRAANTRAKAASLGATSEILIGVIAGVLSRGIALPISAVCVRQQLEDNAEPLLDTIRAIHKEQGFLGLYSALPPSIPLALLPSLTLYIHSVLLRLTPLRHQAHPPGFVTFLIGALSSSLSTIPLYPIILAKVLSQSGTHKAGLVVTMQQRFKRSGMGGLYQGIEGQLAKSVVQQGVMMLLKQRVEEGIVAAYRRM